MSEDDAKWLFELAYHILMDRPFPDPVSVAKRLEAIAERHASRPNQATKGDGQ